MHTARGEILLWQSEYRSGRMVSQRYELATQLSFQSWRSSLSWTRRKIRPAGQSLCRCQTPGGPNHDKGYFRHLVPHPCDSICKDSPQVSGKKLCRQRGWDHQKNRTCFIHWDLNQTAYPHVCTNRCHRYPSLSYGHCWYPPSRARLKKDEVYTKPWTPLITLLLPPSWPDLPRTRALTRPGHPLRTPCPLRHRRSAPTPTIHSLHASLLTLLLLPHELRVLLWISDIEHRTAASIYHSRLLLHWAWYLKTHAGISGNGSSVGVARCCLHGHLVQLIVRHAGDLFRTGLRVARFELRGYLIDGWGHAAWEGLGLCHSRRGRRS